LRKSPFTFKRLERSDLPGVAALINGVIGPGADERYLGWKYLEGITRKTASTVVLVGTRVVGFLGGIPARFLVDGREVIGVEEADSAVVEEYRRIDLGLGVVGFSARSYAEDGIFFTYGVTSKANAELNRTLLGMKEVARIPRLVKVIDIAPFLGKAVPSRCLSTPISRVANAVWFRRPFGTPRIPDGMRLDRLDGFDGRFDEFWERVKGDYRVTLVRDAAYLNWRYAHPANRVYDIFCLEREGTREVYGLLVLGVKREGGILRGQVMEILTPNDGGPEVAGCLAGCAVDHFRRRRVDAVECWMFPHAHQHPGLARKGFVPRGKEHMRLHFRILGGGGGEAEDVLTNSINWRFTMGDSDAG
jgi:hypothetical protein